MEKIFAASALYFLSWRKRNTSWVAADDIVAWSAVEAVWAPVHLCATQISCSLSAVFQEQHGSRRSSRVQCNNWRENSLPEQKHCTNQQKQKVYYIIIKINLHPKCVNIFTVCIANVGASSYFHLANLMDVSDVILPVIILTMLFLRFLIVTETLKT